MAAAAVFLFSRVALLLLGHYAPHLIPPVNGNTSVLPHSDPLSALRDWTAPWFRFDTGWYVGVAEHGYRWGGLGKSNTNFMPLYPLLIRTVQPLTLGSPWIAAWLVANLAFLAALITLSLWASRRWDRQTALRVLTLVTIFPFSFFHFAPYAEPLFLALAAAALVLAEEDRWGYAVVAAGLATITRPVGLAVVLALIALALQRGRKDLALLSAAAITPLIVFVLYLTVAFGRPLAFLTYHSAGWVPPSGSVLHTITSQFNTTLAPFDRIDAALVVIFLASGMAAWKRLGPPYGIYALVGVLLPLVHGLVSMERYVIVLFPVMSLWASWRSSVVQGLVLALSVVGLFIAASMYASGYAIF